MPGACAMERRIVKSTKANPTHCRARGAGAIGRGRHRARGLESLMLSRKKRQHGARTSVGRDDIAAERLPHRAATATRSPRSARAARPRAGSRRPPSALRSWPGSSRCTRTSPAGAAGTRPSRATGRVGPGGQAKRRSGLAHRTFRTPTTHRCHAAAGITLCCWNRRHCVPRGGAGAPSHNFLERLTIATVLPIMSHQSQSSMTLSPNLTVCISQRANGVAAKICTSSVWFVLQSCPLYSWRSSSRTTPRCAPSTTRTAPASAPACHQRR